MRARNDFLHTQTTQVTDTTDPERARIAYNEATVLHHLSSQTAEQGQQGSQLPQPHAAKRRRHASHHHQQQVSYPQACSANQPTTHSTAHSANHPGAQHIVRMLDHFYHTGSRASRGLEGGRRQLSCLVMERLGCTLQGVLCSDRQTDKQAGRVRESGIVASRNESGSVDHTPLSVKPVLPQQSTTGPLPLAEVRCLAWQLLLALDYLHRCVCRAIMQTCIV